MDFCPFGSVVTKGFNQYFYLSMASSISDDRKKYVLFNQLFNCFLNYRKNEYTDSNIENFNMISHLSYKWNLGNNTSIWCCS